VQDRRVGGHRLDGVEDGGQLLVVDLDEVERLLRGVLVDGGDGGDALADEADAAAGEDGHVAQEGAVDSAVDVLAGDDRVDAGEGRGGGGVDAADESVGVGAVEHLAPEDAGQGEVGGVDGAPGDLVGALDARRRLADDLVDHVSLPRRLSFEAGFVVGRMVPESNKQQATSNREPGAR
jgi:hypothetical protein